MAAAPERPLLARVQLLRALAVNLVVLHHLTFVETQAAGPGGAGVLPAFAYNGGAGVDLFFVISGLIMVHVTGPETRAGAFLRDRATRVLPPYWFWTGLVAATMLLAPTGIDAGIAPGGATSPLWRSLLLLPGEGPPLLVVGWTLIHEAYFYLVFALLLWLGRPLAPMLGLWVAALLAAQLALAAAGLAWAAIDPALRLVLGALTLEFAAGAAVGLLLRRGLRGGGGAALLTGGLWFALAFVLADWPPGGRAGDPSWWRVLVYGPPAVLLVYGAAALDLRRSSPAGRLWAAGVRLGDASYATYLSHLFAINAVAVLAAGTGLRGTPAALATVAAGLVAANLVGLAARRWIERPLTTGARRLVGRR